MIVKPVVIVGALAVIVIAIALAAAYKGNSVMPSESSSDTPDYGVQDLGAQTVPWWDFSAQLQTVADEVTSNNEANTVMNNPQANLQAFLQTIAHSEGTANQPDAYRVCFGYKHTINSFADHPAITGEWRGEKLSDAMCKGAGLSPGCVSTAAGKYQIIKPTWLSLKNKLGLTDFGPASQDACATELLRQCGSLSAIERGDFASAVSRAKKIWASLPGAGYGQGERSLSWLQAKYEAAGGGVLA